MRYLSTIVLMLVLVGFQEALFAQSAFDVFLKEQHLIFKKPQGYKLFNVEDEDEIRFYCLYGTGRKENVSADEFFLRNKDSSVVIMLQDVAFQEMKGILWPYWYDDNKMFYSNAIGKATAVGDLRFYNSNELRDFNADGAVEFTRKCDVPGNTPGYRANRSIYVSKSSRGSFNLIYLFKDTVIAAQDKIINETKHMLIYSVEKQEGLNRKKISDKHYATTSTMTGLDTLATLWNRGGVYNNLYYFNREQYAYAFGNITISVQFPINKEWPYFNAETTGSASFLVTSNLRMGESPEAGKWSNANDEFKKYLTLAKGPATAISVERLTKVNADQGYIFDFKAFK